MPLSKDEFLAKIFANSATVLNNVFEYVMEHPEQVSGLVFGNAAYVIGTVITIALTAAITAAYMKNGPKKPAPITDVQRHEAKRKLGMDTVNEFNIGFIGSSGAGKSSLITFLMGLPECHPDAPKVSDSGQGTTEAKGYKHPTIPHLKFYDMPGGGTVDFRAATYFTDNCLYAFDHLIIMSSTDRLQELCVDVANRAFDEKIPVTFARSRSDIPIANSNRRIDNFERAKLNIHAAAKTETIVALARNHYKDPTPNVFVFSCHVMTGYLPAKDFGLEEAALIDHIYKVAEKYRS